MSIYYTNDIWEHGIAVMEMIGICCAVIYIWYRLTDFNWWYPIGAVVFLGLTYLFGYIKHEVLNW